MKKYLKLAGISIELYSTDHGSKMFNLVNSAYNRTYNPSGKPNALSDIKRLLLSRDTVSQKKACSYLTEVVSRCNKNSKEQIQMINYLLDNDIAVFLCEATTNLEFELFRSTLECMRLLWRSSRFFAEEHAAHAMAAVVRTLMHYAESGNNMAVNTSLNFLDDLLNGISAHKTAPPLSDQSVYSTVQLLACLSALLPHITTYPKSLISTSLVLHALISYQPDNLTVKASTANALVDVSKKCFTMLLGALNHSVLVNNEFSGMFYTVLCYLSIDVLRLAKLLSNGQQNSNFVQSILADEQEIDILQQCVNDMNNSLQLVLSELITYTKDHENEISSEEYGIFLKCLLIYFCDNVHTKSLSELGDILFSKGYLTMLPQVQINRNDVTIRKASTLVLGEMLKVLSDKYLYVNDMQTDSGTCAKDIHMGLIELQYGIEKPQDIGSYLQKGQPYGLLIYIYFYCQSTENPEEATGPLLPYLVEHVLRLPRSFKPPPYIIKALWLVFAMSAISNNSLESLDERVYLEKATDRIIAMLHPEPSIYYTHNPAILLWSFTSQRIPNYIKLIVLSEWLKTEDTLPLDLTTEPIVWELLLHVLVQNTDVTVTKNCMDVLQTCSQEKDEDKQKFTILVWNMLPDILSKALIDDCQIDTNICHLLDLATTLVPMELEETTYLKTAVLITAIFAKNNHEYSGDSKTRYHYEYVCLKLSLYLLGLASNQNDNRVLLMYINRNGFLSNVLSATNSLDDTVACVALQLLSYIVHYFNRNNYQPKSVLQIDTNLVIQSLRKDSLSERGASLLQLVYMVLNSGANALITLTSHLEQPPNELTQYNALRALMLRVQMMLCCGKNKNQSSAGWKTLSAIFKHSIISKNDTRLVATLTSQPWTHILIQFQLTQTITQEFLTFIQNWLNLLRITINKNREEKRVHMCEQSLIIKTLVILKKHLIVDDEFKEFAEKVLCDVKIVLYETGLRIE